MDLIFELISNKVPTYSQRRKMIFSLFIENHISIILDPRSELGILDKLNNFEGPITDKSQLVDIFGPITEKEFVRMFKWWLCNYQLLSPINAHVKQWHQKNNWNTAKYYFGKVGLDEEANALKYYISGNPSKFDEIFYMIMHEVPCQTLGLLVDLLCE